MFSWDSGRYCVSQLCSLSNRRIFILANVFSKNAACSCQAGSLVSGTSCEFFGSGMPARKRATSSAPDNVERTGILNEASALARALAVFLAGGSGVLYSHGHLIPDIGVGDGCVGAADGTGAALADNVGAGRAGA